MRSCVGVFTSLSFFFLKEGSLCSCLCMYVWFLLLLLFLKRTLDFWSTFNEKDGLTWKGGKAGL